MTTPVGNNSVFRSFFEKQKLTGPNFIDWYRQLRLQVPLEALAAHGAWVKGQKEVDELKALYSKQVEHELLQTVREFHACKQKECQSVSSYVLKMKSYIDNLERLGQHVSQNLAASLILVSLNKDYDSFVYNYNMHDMRKIVNELYAMLKLHEETLAKKDANPALYAIRAGRVQKNQKNKPHKANKGGSRWALEKELSSVSRRVNIKKKLSQGASTSGIFTIELDSLPSKSWIYETGCGTHICITAQGLRGSKKLKPGSCLFDDGFINRFDENNVISVLKNNLVYFMAVLRYGIFEIDMSCSNTNDSSMYAISNKRAKINLESSLLWHCRLGHISKKCIEKLQHDGLLNSIDTESLGKCVSYFSDTSLDHEKDDQEIDEPQSDINPIRKFSRTRRAPDRMCLYIDAEEHELGDLGEPDNYKAALLDLKFKKWLDAMNVEMQSMKNNDVWVLVELPPNARIVGSKWLFKKKTNMDGVVYVFKARLVAKGFTQTYRVDYEETFSPVADIRSIRILIAIAAYYNYEIWQMDVKTAFLNGYLFEEVYMEQPKGFVNLKYPNHVCKLKRFIYRLKQASRQWNKRFDDEIKKLGFTQNRDEPCVYQNASGSYVAILILYIDDILLIENNILMLQDVKSYLGRSFAMKDLGDAAYILGTKIYLDRSKRLIGLCQRAYIEKILKKYYMENSKRGTIPMQKNLKLSKSQGALTPAKKQCMQNVPYASAIGSIMCAVRCTRPDVAVSCYTDAGYLTDANDLKSQTGYLFVLNGGAVNWKSTKQSIFAPSSTDAEYIAAFDASKEAVWICKFISGLGIVPTIEEPDKKSRHR
nr:retrotransposon protein, putative, Ty1-copia subclass [Tanacetum cinerariifolium]